MDLPHTETGSNSNCLQGAHSPGGGQPGKQMVTVAGEIRYGVSNCVITKILCRERTKNTFLKDGSVYPRWRNCDDSNFPFSFSYIHCNDHIIFELRRKFVLKIDCNNRQNVISDSGVS